MNLLFRLTSESSGAHILSNKLTGECTNTVLLSVELPEVTQPLELLGKDSSDIVFIDAGSTWHGTKCHITRMHIHMSA